MIQAVEDRLRVGPLLQPRREETPERLAVRSLDAGLERVVKETDALLDWPKAVDLSFVAVRGEDSRRGRKCP